MTQIFPFIRFLIVFSIGIKANNETDFYQEVKNSRDFNGKVVLITGSDSGIGEQTVKLFAALGASVVVTGRNPDSVRETAQEVQALSPKRLRPLEIVADLTNQDEVKQLLNRTIKQFGRLDVLVNNAGSYIYNPITGPNFMAKFDKNLAIDVRPALQLIRLAIPFLIRTKGTIINISSILTERPASGMLSYVVAKEALKKATQVLAQELGPFGIRINTIRIESHGQSSDSKVTAELTPLRRNGQPSDIARVVVFLASTDAQFITGENIDIDGGLKFTLAGR